MWSTKNVQPAFFIREDEICKKKKKKKKIDKSWELDTCVILRERYYRQLEYLYLFMSISVIIYGSGFVPDWLIGLFKPIYKNKGNPLKRYGYTIILSCPR